MVTCNILKSPRYFEWRTHPSRSVIVAGVGRSGTTWLGDVVSRMINARVIFEPCLTDKNGNFLIDRQGSVNLQNKYEMPLPLWKNACFEEHKPVIAHMLFGSIQGGWIDQDVQSGIYSRRVIKMIRANFFVGHLARVWPELKIVYVVRLPHKVVESMLNQEQRGWNFDWPVHEIRNLATACKDWRHLVNFCNWDQENLVDRLAFRWCVETKIALQQLDNQPNAMIVRYEDLVRGDQWSNVAGFLADRGCRGLPDPALLGKPSKTTSRCAVTSKQLTQEEMSRIRQMACSFGLERWVE